MDLKGYGNIVLTEVIAEILKCGDIVKKSDKGRNIRNQMIEQI